MSIGLHCHGDSKMHIVMGNDWFARFRLWRGAYHHFVQELTRLSAYLKLALYSFFYLLSAFEIRYSQPPCASQPLLQFPCWPVFCVASTVCKGRIMDYGVEQCID